MEEHNIDIFNLCELDGINYWSYVVFLETQRKYLEMKRNVEKLKNTPLNNRYKNSFIRKNILQGRYFSDDDYIDVFNILKDKLFNWLNKASEPYFYLFYTYKYYSTYNNKYGLYSMGGINKDTIEIAKDYALRNI